MVRYPWAVAAGLVGSRWVDLAGEHFDHMCFLQGKVSITRPHAQVTYWSPGRMPVDDPRPKLDRTATAADGLCIRSYLARAGA